MKKILIPFQTTRVKNGKFLPSDMWGGCNFGTEISGTLTARYYKGIESDHSMAIIEKVKNDKEIQFSRATRLE